MAKKTKYWKDVNYSLIIPLIQYTFNMNSRRIFHSNQPVVSKIYIERKGLRMAKIFPQKNKCEDICCDKPKLFIELLCGFGAMKANKQPIRRHTLIRKVIYVPVAIEYLRGNVGGGIIGDPWRRMQFDPSKLFL